MLVRFDHVARIVKTRITGEQKKAKQAASKVARRVRNHGGIESHTAPCAVKRAGIVDRILAEKYYIRRSNAIVARSCEAGGRLRQRYGLIVKGKRISCPPHYAPPNNDYDPPHHDYEHGFPLIRSLRASAQRSTSVLFSFVFSSDSITKRRES